jgi:UrcA family protein
MKIAMTTQFKSTPLLVAAGCVALSFAALSGRAQAADQQPLSKVVAYADLNIDSEQGAQVLYTRLRGAAKDVCFPLESRDLLKNRWQRCFDSALASAVAHVNTVRVTALHNRTVGHPAKS